MPAAETFVRSWAKDLPEGYPGKEGYETWEFNWQHAARDFARMGFVHLVSESPDGKRFECLLEWPSFLVGQMLAVDGDVGRDFNGGIMPDSLDYVMARENFGPVRERAIRYLLKVMSSERARDAEKRSKAAEAARGRGK